MNRKERRKNKVITNPQAILNIFNEGFACHKNGELDKAEIFYEKVLKVMPNHFETLRHLGIVYQDRHLLDQALNYFLKAQKIEPNHFAIYNNLGSLKFQQVKLDESMQFYEKSFQLNPDYLPVLNNLTLLYQRNNYADKALNMAKKALSIDKNNLFSKSNYGLALTINNRLEEAIDVFKEVIKIQATGPNLKNLGTAYRDIGMLDKSHDYFLKAIEDSPNDESIFFNLTASSLYQPDMVVVHGFEGILKNSDKLDLNQKTAIAFSLYRSYHKLKKHSIAGKYLVLGNEYSDAWIGSNIEREHNFINEIKNIFNRKFIKENSIKVIEDVVQPIFILGMPRSGTTLCEQILSSHSEVCGGGELPHLIRNSGLEGAYNLNAKQIETGKKILEEMQDNLFEKQRDGYIKKLEDISLSHKYVTDKMPHNFIFIGLIKMLFPKAKIIYCKRDAMDNCFSLYVHKFTDMNHGYCYNQEILGKYYNLHVELMNYWKDIFKEDIFTLEHEQLINHQEDVSRKLIEYCGLKWEPACLEFYKTKRQVQTASNEQVRKPINKDSMAAWKKYEEFLNPLKNALEENI